MARLLYSLVWLLALPVLLARLWWRGIREPGYREHVAERLGGGTPAVDGRPVLWLHAVSVGEARASAPLVRALAAAFPESRLLLTCTTAAGRATLETLHGDRARIAWLPWDLPFAVRRFLALHRPALGILLETEVWPNLLAACRERSVPVLLANARLSEPSAAGYARWPSLTRPAFASFAAVCAQSAEDAGRLRAAGAAEIEVAGNLKFDVEPDAKLAAAGRAWRGCLGGRRALLLASTREGDEARLLDALGVPPQNMLLLIVPRHPRRFDEVAALIAARGAAASRRSLGEAPAGPVHLGDTMGEMTFYFAAADVALMGGSFTDLGGQNLIEACAAGTPVVLGPDMHNFAEATRLALAAGAAVQATDAEGAMREALRLMGDAAARRRMGEAGIALCAAHRGATARHVARCRSILARARAPG
jgi:3-deoxy-D-manno-octulosonic-acid transferase